MTANSMKLNVYRITVDEPGNDLLTLLDVAAPNARAASATLAVSGLATGSTIKSIEKYQDDVPHVSLGDEILVWEQSHGYVAHMGDTVPVETQHLGNIPEDEIDWSRYE